MPAAPSIARVMVKPEWLLHLESELAQNPRSTVYSLATVQDGAPRVRSVVHRAFTPSGLLLSTTDVRMPKTAQLASDSRVEIAWWLPTHVQFRISGRAYIVPASGNGGGNGGLSRAASTKSNTALRRNASTKSNHSRSLSAGDSRPQLTITPSDTDVSSSGDMDGDSTHLSPVSPSIERPRWPRHGSASSNKSNGNGSGEGNTPHHSPPLPSPNSDSTSPRFHPSPSAALSPAITLADEGVTQPSLAGTLSALQSWGVVPTAPETSRSWWEAERNRIWESLSPELRATFARPADPGSALADAPDPDSWPTTLNNSAANPAESKTLAAAWENFAVVALAPERVEMLELACTPHKRAAWVRSGDVWVKEELVP